MIEIKKITFEDTLTLWKEGLPNMSLEPCSAMSCMKKMVLNENDEYNRVDHYDLENQKFTPTFWGAFYEDKLIGCNSGHMTLDRLYRSRGLYVKEEYRGQRAGQKLLLKTISQGVHEKAIGIWSYPRREAWITYHHCGFLLSSHSFNFGWESNEDGQENSRCLRVIDSVEVRKLENEKGDISHYWPDKK